MKNKIFLFVLALVTVVLLSSCLFIPKAYKTFLDTNASAEETATVIFDGDFWIRTYNGTGIYTSKNIVLPAGNTNFLFNLYFTFGNQYSTTTYKFEDIELHHFFEQGKKYKIKATSKSLGLFKGTEFYIELFDITKSSSVKLKEWMVGKT
jgi:hypothetical protein